MRVLGLCASTSSCEHNWSTFKFVSQNPQILHWVYIMNSIIWIISIFVDSYERKTLEANQLNDLMFVNYNVELHERTEKAKLLEEDASIKFDPICLEELKWWLDNWIRMGIQWLGIHWRRADWAFVEKAIGMHENVAA